MRRRYGPAAMAVMMLWGACAAAQPLTLPGVSDRPLSIDFSTDPLLLHGRTVGPEALFAQAVRGAIERHPRVAVAVADRDEQRARLHEAQSGWLPTLDLRLSTDRSLSRSFGSNDNSILERFRSTHRSDAVADIEQLLFDFGATDRRIAAERARVSAEGQDVRADADMIALRLTSSWSTTAGATRLVALVEAMLANETALRAFVERSIGQGVLAQGDLARINAAIASSQARLATARRTLEEARARYQEASGEAAPPDLMRPGLPRSPIVDADAVRELVGNSPPVIAAKARARAAQLDTASLNAEKLPRLQASINAGRYGLFENQDDYDIRGQLTLRYRLNGMAFARAEAADARSRSREADVDRILGEANRDALAAWTDVAAIERQLDANAAAYRANRQARDMVMMQFRAQRGSLFDVLAADDAHFRAALDYLQTVSDLDTAKAVLLSRTGLLLDLLGIVLPGSEP